MKNFNLVLQLLLPLAALVFFAWFFSDIFLYFVIATVLTAILKTPTNYIAQLQIMGYRTPRALAILASFAIMIGVIGLFVLLFIPLVSEQIKVIASINYEELVGKLAKPVYSFEEFLVEKGFIQAQEEGKSFIVDEVKSKIFDMPIQSKLANLLNDIISTTGSVLIGILAVLFMSFFLLYEKGIIRRSVLALIPNKYFEVSISAIYKVEHLLSQYLLGLLLQMVSIFSVVSIGLLVAGVKYALTIAVFAALANLIPYLGPVLGASFGLIVGLSTNPELVEMQDYIIFILKIGIVFVMMQLTDNIILQPFIFSRSVKAHPLEIFVIVFVGAGIAGALGMIAAIPVYTIVRVTTFEFYRGYKQYQIFTKQE
ncbi:MAG: AI-2E family transporter [Bernardetiaceae bacterium]|nr:AI-2E family transporter [Bernardetiaceae bacterium]